MFTFKELTIRALIMGLIIGIFFCILNVIVGLKTGLAFAGTQVTILLGFLGLSATGGYDKFENNIIQASASGAALAMFTIDSAVAAVVIFSGVFPSLYLVIAISLVAIPLGILFAYSLKDTLLERQNLSFPGGIAIGEVIEALVDTRSKRSLLVFLGMGIGMVIVALVQWHMLPKAIPGLNFGIPTFLGLAISPMMVGMGFIIRHRSASLIFAGSLFSTTIWFLSGKQHMQLSQHITNPWVLSVAVFMIITYSLYLIIKSRKIFKNMFSSVQLGEGGRYIRIGQIILLALAVILFVAIPEIRLMPYALLILIPFLLVTVLYACWACGETGMTPVTPMGMLGLIIASFFTDKLAGILFAGAVLSAAGAAASTMMNTFRAGVIVKSRPEALLTAQTVGSLLGAVVGSVSIFMLFKAYGFGTEQLPAPLSYSWGVVASALQEGRVPESINIFIGAGASLGALLLAVCNLSAISFGIGMIIPPAYSSLIFIGGLFSYWIQRKFPDKEIQKEKMGEGYALCAGFIAGEGLILVISAFYTVLAA